MTAGSAAKIAVVDYCKGNLASVERGLSDAGFDARITDQAADITCADGLVLPGVGAFADAMTTMVETGQAAALREAMKAGVPFLGICLGLHLIFDWGDEGCAQGQRMSGLGTLPGHVERMAAVDAGGAKHKIPHVGWNSVELVGAGEGAGEESGATAAAGGAGEDPAADIPNPLFAGVPDGSYFYFTHSYCAVPDDAAVISATTTHARRFVAAVRRGNVYGVQFHPEKSSALGLRVLKNFGHIVEAHA